MNILGHQGQKGERGPIGAGVEGPQGIEGRIGRHSCIILLLIWMHLRAVYQTHFKSAFSVSIALIMSANFQGMRAYL